MPSAIRFLARGALSRRCRRLVLELALAAGPALALAVCVGLSVGCIAFKNDDDRAQGGGSNAGDGSAAADGAAEADAPALGDQASLGAWADSSESAVHFATDDAEPVDASPSDVGVDAVTSDARPTDVVASEPGVAEDASVDAGASGGSPDADAKAQDGADIACQGQRDDVIDDLPDSSSDEPLALYGSTWMRSVSIPVCFWPEPALALVQGVMDDVRRTVTDGWSRSGAIGFNGFLKCQVEASAGSVVVKLGANLGKMPANVDRIGDPGPGTHTTVSFSEARPSARTILHAFGHVLGFLHEPFLRAGQKGKRGDGAIGGVPTSVMSQDPCHASSGLSPWDVVGVQNAYGRRANGSIVGMNGQCLDIPFGEIPSGTRAQVYPCHTDNGPNQQWRAMEDGTLVAPAYSTSTLSVLEDDEKQVIITEKGSPVPDSQRWEFANVEIRGIGRLCVGAAGGQVNEGASLELNSCVSTPGQRWNISWISQRLVHVAAGGSALCVTAPNPAVAGADLRIERCDATGTSQIFTISPLGELRYQGLCWASESKDPEAGRKVQLQACAADGPGKRNQEFILRGNIKSALGACLTVKSADFESWNDAIVSDCSNSAGFLWDYYFNP